jgi:hypothetical protein
MGVILRRCVSPVIRGFGLERLGFRTDREAELGVGERLEVDG